MHKHFNQDLETAIYDIAGGAGSWGNLLSLMREKNPDTLLALVIAGQDGRTQVLQHAIAGYESSFVNSYISYYQNINVWSRLHSQFTRVSTVYNTRERKAMPVQQDLLKSEFYYDWVKPQDDAREGVAMMLGHNGTDTISLAANVPYRAADELLPFWTDTFKSLVKPMSLVANVQMLRNELGLQNKNLEIMVSSITDSAFLVSGQGHVLFCNQAAQTVLGEESSLRLQANGDVQFAEASAQAVKLSNVLLSSLLSRGWRMFTLARGGLRKPLIVTVLQLAGYGPMMGQKLPRYLLIVKDPEAKADLPPPTVVEELLGLTRAEAKIALQLARTGRTAEVAEALQLSPNTVRNHISAILHKTGFTRSAEIVSFIKSLSSQLRQNASSAP